MKLLPCLLLASTAMFASSMPQIVHTADKYTLMVDGKPYIVLGAQVDNSSGWPAPFEALLPGATAMGLNTLEVPAYWEDIEPREGEFHFDTFDKIIESARAHNFRLVLLWFGTWKNGAMDYAPAWVKADPVRFPRMLDQGHSPVRVLTPLSDHNRVADRTAFAALMKHLKQVDGDQHTVIMVQVENESGSLFTDRDHSPDAEAKFAAQVPAEVLTALHKKPGTWTEVFGAEASETFAAYYVSRYVNSVAEAGKKEYPLPFYANVWLREMKNFMRPGEAYPSGGGTLNMLPLWKAMTPSLDAVAPDNYLLDYVNYRAILAGYHRADNPLLVPETGGPRFASNIFYALGDYDALGYAPFGLDKMLDGAKVKEAVQPLADDLRLLTPALPFIATMQGTGKLHAAVEEQYLTEHLVRSSRFDVLIQFGNPHPEYGGIFGTQTPKMSGRALVAELAPDEFIIIGFDARADFRPLVGAKDQSAQFLRAEEGTFVDGQWKTTHLLNGDETFFGIRLPAEGKMIRVKLMSY
ncbi:DUF5597 domain-containing protein [Granulicella arctica]|uniref:DUF5597 domain-containing protein n=1 Tax=Granulicella arctica TaxID=940613 RepID=UPI0021DFB254|nr:DUF5597 domain-containing protein [Granulicella arctica]